jgi:hypothetical protein
VHGPLPDAYMTPSQFAYPSGLGLPDVALALDLLEEIERLRR